MKGAANEYKDCSILLVEVQFQPLAFQEPLAFHGYVTKQLAELPLFLITPILFVGIMYYMVGLNPLFERFLIATAILELLTQVVVSFGKRVT